MQKIEDYHFTKPGDGLVAITFALVAMLAFIIGFGALGFRALRIENTGRMAALCQNQHICHGEKIR